MGKEIRCVRCGDVIKNEYRRNFQWCTCRSIFIEGGDDYCRMGGNFKHILVEYNKNWVLWDDLRKDTYDKRIYNNG